MESSISTLPDSRDRHAISLSLYYPVIISLFFCLFHIFFPFLALSWSDVTYVLRRRVVLLQRLYLPRLEDL